MALPKEEELKRGWGSPQEGAVGLRVTPKRSPDWASPGTGSPPRREGKGGAGQGGAHQWDQPKPQRCPAPCCWSHPRGPRQRDTRGLSSSTAPTVAEPRIGPKLVLSPPQAWCRRPRAGTAKNSQPAQEFSAAKPKKRPHRCPWAGDTLPKGRPLRPARPRFLQRAPAPGLVPAGSRPLGWAGGTDRHPVPVSSASATSLHATSSLVSPAVPPGLCSAAWRG